MCDAGSGGAQAVSNLGGGIVNGLSPSESFTDFYNRHVGADTSSCFYAGVSGVTLAGSLFFGDGEAILGIKGLEAAEDAAKAGDEAIDLASNIRRNHILYGDGKGGGHLYPGLPR